MLAGWPLLSQHSGQRGKAEGLKMTPNYTLADIEKLFARVAKLEDLLLGRDCDDMPGQMTTPEQKQEMERMIEVVAREFGVTRDQILGHRRPRVIAEPRMVCMALMVERGGLSLCQVGNLMGRDHCTVLNARRRVLKLCECYGDFAQRVNRCVAEYTASK